MLKLPVNLSQIATNNNICVYEANLPEDISGSIRYNPEIKKFEILLNKKEDENGKFQSLSKSNNSLISAKVLFSLNLYL